MPNKTQRKATTKAIPVRLTEDSVNELDEVSRKLGRSRSMLLKLGAEAIIDLDKQGKLEGFISNNFKNKAQLN